MTKETKISAFSPFHHRVFAVLWGATLISNIGTWMFNVTSGWLMTDLAPSPLMVSLVQAATALPIFLFAIPAGAFGDLFDRRRLLIITQILSAVALFIFAGLLWVGAVGAWTLLFFTFLTGAMSAFAMPAWQAIVPRLVPKNELAPAIALNGVSVNIARAIGPALGGFILVAMGAVATVVLDAVSFLVIVAALLWWKTTTPQTTPNVPRERLVGAMQAGVRFSVRSLPLRHTLVRAFAFFVFASAYWALLPLLAKDVLQGGPGLYGILLTALGAGAIAGTFMLAPLKTKIGPNRILALASGLTALGMVVMAYGGTEIAGIAGAFIAGIGWILAVSSLNVSAQLSLPDWVRARGLAVFQMVFFGAMTLGSIVWGHVAGLVGLSETLAVAAAMIVVGIPLTWRFHLNRGEGEDYTPSHHWPEPMLAAPVDHDRGPVLVTLEYRIDDADREKFYHLMTELGDIRRRDGAIQWGFFEDVEDHGRFIEMFTAESWADHLRHHDRVTESDRVLQKKIHELHRGKDKPHTMHAVMPGLSGGNPKKIPKDHKD